MTRAPRTPVGRALLGALALATALAVLPATPALAGPGGNFRPPASDPPPSTTQAQEATVQPQAAPTRTCQLYGSASGFGMACSGGGAGTGRTLAEIFADAGIDTSDSFCWDDPDLPDGFQPPEPTTGPGRWWLHTCLTFTNAVVDKSTARLTYEYVFLPTDGERTLTDPESEAVSLITGRGQIPFLQVQASPVSSPRVDQDVAFSLLCDSSRGLDCSGIDAGQISTPRLAVGGVTMWAEVVHLRVRPEGAGRPATVGCRDAGLVRTAEQLDATADDPRVCRFAYDRSSNGQGGGTRGDRFPAQVTAYWQIYYDSGNGVPQQLGATYEKTTVNQIRVTEVQTLVVS